MRNFYKIAAFGLSGLFMTGCADTTIDLMQVDKPQSIADYEYLDAYGSLKEYINRSAHPGFTLGTGVGAADYANKGLVYRVTNTNFDMMTAGNAMKYASVVKDNGDMDFSTVESFVEAAKGAGMQIYGHTLLWHSQQNNKYLNGLIADKEIEVDPDAREEVEDFIQNYDNLTSFPYYVMGYAPDIIDGVLTSYNPTEWHQYFVMDGLKFKEGIEYTVTARMKGSIPGTLTACVGNWGATSDKPMEFTDEWTEVSQKFGPLTVDGGFCVFQPGGYQGTLEIDWVKLSHSEAPVMEIGMPLISGGDADKGQSDNLIARELGNADISARVVDDPKGTGKVYECTYNANPTNDWDSQFFIKSNESLSAGTKVHVKFRYRASDARSISTQAHGAPGNYHHWEFIGTLNATEEWQDHEWTGEISSSHAGDEGCSSIAFNLCGAPAGGTFYIDDVVFEKMVSTNTLPLSDEEKYEILDAELGRWIKGMMDATGGYVKAWDLMNEGLCDTWGDIDLKHASNQDPNDAANCFYWQDYLGENYVRNAAKYARQYYAEQEGADPSELKLFINDYNLEAAYNNNDKAKSLVNWINKWEADGETKIDGIGSQMHVSYSCNPDEQKRREDAVVNMLNILANSGKLVRITELDMGIDDENGNAIKTADVTLEQHKAMGEYYRFIIKKYFEIIPVGQQFGICQWAQTDSPENSGWRANSPIGLWNLNYQRKPTYGGFCDGLKEE